MGLKMKYAIVNGQRQEAKPGRSGVCPACDSPLVARCGDVRVHHWAHHAGSDCDPWWEDETEWHRNWKDQFPDNWQEVLFHSKKGGRHIADVKTGQGWVLEFRHSTIDPEECRARETFYRNLIWIVDGTNRERDKTRFFKAWKSGELIDKKQRMRRISLTDKCTLLQAWAGSRVPVFFDFSGCSKAAEAQLSFFDSFGWKKPEESYLWWLIQVIDKKAYVAPFLRSELLKYHGPEADKMELDFRNLQKEFHKKAYELARLRQHRSSRLTLSVKEIYKRLRGKSKHL